jgi:hypothetical protein
MWQDQTQQGNSKQTLEKEKRRHSLHNSPCHTQPSHRNHAFTHHVKRTLYSNHMQPNQLPQTTQHHEHKRIIQGHKKTSDIPLSDWSLATGPPSGGGLSFRTLCRRNAEFLRARWPCSKNNVSLPLSASELGREASSDWKINFEHRNGVVTCSWLNNITSFL